jgi:hypothetical protein
MKLFKFKQFHRKCRRPHPAEALGITHISVAPVEGKLLLAPAFRLKAWLIPAQGKRSDALGMEP